MRSRFFASILLCSFLLASCAFPTSETVQETPSEPSTWSSPSTIYVYPFSDSELEAAKTVILSTIPEFKNEPGVLSYEIEHIDFDPILTDHCVLTEYNFGPYKGATIEELYQRFIGFTVTYSAHYDQSLSPLNDIEHGQLQFILEKDNISNQWRYYSHGNTVSSYSALLVHQDEYSHFFPDVESIIAAYKSSTNSHSFFLYVLDSETGTILYVET